MVLLESKLYFLTLGMLLWNVGFFTSLCFASARCSCLGGGFFLVALGSALTLGGVQGFSAIWIVIASWFLALTPLFRLPVAL